MFEQAKINPDEVASVTIGTTVISFQNLHPHSLQPSP